MSTYIIKRLLLMIPTLFGITFLTYVIIRSAPGDPTAMKGDLEKGPKRDRLTAGDQGDYRKLLHLDKPAYVAYFHWVKDFFNPKANVSAVHKTFVFDVILDRLPYTMIFNIYSLVFFYGLGLTLGIDSAVHARSVRERVITFILFLLYSLPGFWVGLNLIVFLGRGGRLLQWLPQGLTLFRWLVPVVVVLFILHHLVRKVGAAGETSADVVKRNAVLLLGSAQWLGLALVCLCALALLALKFGNPITWSELGTMVFSREVPLALRGLPIAGVRPDQADRMSYLTQLGASVPFYILPLFCMVYGGLASESRFMRVGLLEILRQDYIRTATAKGLPAHTVVLRHALPNALTPIIVQVAGIFPSMIGGSVIIETIFSIPGMGFLFYEAVQARDYNLVMALSFMGAVLTLLGILISDLLLPAVDPRISFEGRKG